MAASTLVFCVLLVGIFVSSGEALNCYVCSGVLDKGCNDPFQIKEEFKKPCTFPSCYRLTVSNENFKNVTMRTCGPAEWEKITDVPIGRRYSKTYFNCTWDYCNQSSNLNASPFLLLAPIFFSGILAFLLYK